MTIADEIARIQGNINNAYSALYDKGATMPTTNNTALLADTINTISTGGGGSGEVGRYWVDNGIAERQAGNIDGRFKGIVGINNSVFYDAFNGTGLGGEANFCNCISIGQNGLRNSFANCQNITGAVFCNLTTVQANGMRATFSNCRNLSEANLQSLVSINSFAYECFNHTFALAGTNTENGLKLNFDSLTEAYQMDGCFYNAKLGKEVNFPVLVNANFQNAFQDTSGIETLNMSSAVNISIYNCFYNSKDLVNVYLNNIVNISQSGFYSAFANCKNLAYVNLEKLTRVYSSGSFGGFQSTFSGCSNLPSMYLPNLSTISSNGARYCFSNCQNLKTITIGTTNIVNNCCTIININSASMSCLDTAFYNTGIEKVNLRTSASTVDMWAFRGAFATCQNLTNAHVEFNNASSSSFLNAFANCQNLNYIQIGGSIFQTDCCQNICRNCTNLTSVSIFLDDYGQTLTLQDNAFRNSFLNCPSLNSIGIEAGSLNGSGLANFVSGHNDISLDLTQCFPSDGADPFVNMLAGTNNCTVILETVTQSGIIDELPSYQANFGGNNVSIVWQGEE